MKTDYSKLVHFFGEMDLDLTKNFEQVFKKAFHISECCGYMVTKYTSKQFPKESKITLYGREGEEFDLWFFDGNLSQIHIKQGSQKMVVTQIPNYEGSGYGGYF